MSEAAGGHAGSEGNDWAPSDTSTTKDADACGPRSISLGLVSGEGRSPVMSLGVVGMGFP